MHPRREGGGRFGPRGGGSLMPLTPLPSSRGGGTASPDANWAVGSPTPEVAAVLLRHRLLVTGPPSAKLPSARALGFAGLRSERPCPAVHTLWVSQRLPGFTAFKSNR